MLEEYCLVSSRPSDAWRREKRLFCSEEKPYPGFASDVFLFKFLALNYYDTFSGLFSFFARLLKQIQVMKSVLGKV